jgi:hypothetical protein
MKSMQRVLRCDGLIAAKMSRDDQFPEVKPEDLREMKAYIDAHRAADSPFDIVVEPHLLDLPPTQQQEMAQSWQEAGATWCIEGLWNTPGEEVEARIRQGPPRF